MQINDGNFASFVATMATVLEDIERRQAIKLQQPDRPTSPATLALRSSASPQPPILASHGYEPAERKVA